MMYEINLVHYLALSQRKGHSFRILLYRTTHSCMIITVSGTSISPTLIAYTAAMLIMD